MFKKIITKPNNRITYVTLLIVLLLSVIIKLFVLGNQLQNGILLTNTLDYSWQSDIIERLLHGYIAGRDFIITYGPLYQWITAIPSLLFKLPSYNGLLYSQILLYCIAIINIFFIAKLLVNEKKEHILLFLYILLIVNFFLFPDANNLVRLTIPLLYALLYMRYSEFKRKPYIPQIILLVLPALAGLYVYDLFLTLFLISIAGSIFNLVKNKYSKTAFLQVFLQIGIVIGFEIVISLLLSNNLNYILYSLTTVRDYQFIENIPFSMQKSIILSIFPISLLIGIIYIYKTSYLQNGNKNLLLMLTITAFFELKSAFIRSDEGHIIMGIYPSIIILFIIFYFIYRKKNVGVMFVIVFFFYYILIPYKDSVYQYLLVTNFKSAVVNLKHPRTFFEIYKLPENYYYSKSDFTYFEKIITQNPGNVFIYPYDTYILNIYKQTYNTLPLQFYDYSNSIVEQKAVEQLSKTPPKFIILGVDTKGAIMLDNIPNFSRNPIIAKWMLTHYSVYQKTNKYLVLQFNPHKKNVIKGNACSIYDIDTVQIMQTNIFEKLLKPSTFYLNSYNLRLPYKPNVAKVFIVNDYNNSQKLSSIFESNIDFTQFKTINKNNIFIIKKYPLPKINHVFTNISESCYY